jgi:hypothetical protein
VWHSNIWSTSHHHPSEHSLTVRLHDVSSPSSPSWWITTVYGPHTDANKLRFLQELREVQASHARPWLICGDFNLICRSMDKNNSRINHRLMVDFWRLLDNLELLELHLHGRLYTWSNEQAHSNLSKIDHTFASLHWCDIFLHHRLRVAASSCSDHSPLLLHTNVEASTTKRFRFESIWPKFLGYMEAVAMGWHLTLQNVDACRVLDFELWNTTKELK